MGGNETHTCWQEDAMMGLGLCPKQRVITVVGFATQIDTYFRPRNFQWLCSIYLNYKSFVFYIKRVFSMYESRLCPF